MFARGWEHAAWQQGYYPPDLPPDWRLSYFGNDFRQVMVPRDDWRDRTDQELRAWHEDVGDGFLFLLEAGCSSTRVEEALMRRWLDLPETFGALLCDDDRVLWRPVAPLLAECVGSSLLRLSAADCDRDLRYWRDRLQDFLRQAPDDDWLCLLLDDACWQPRQIEQWQQLARMLTAAERPSNL